MDLAHLDAPQFKPNFISRTIGEPMVVMPALGIIVGASYKMLVAASQIQNLPANRGSIAKCNVNNIDDGSIVYMVMFILLGISGVLLVVGAMNNCLSGRRSCGGGVDETSSEHQDILGNAEGAQSLVGSGVQYVQKAFFQVLATPADRIKFNETKGENCAPSAKEIFDVGSKNGVVRAAITGLAASNFLDCFVQFFADANEPENGHPKCDTRGYPNPASEGLTIVFVMLFIISTIYNVLNDRRSAQLKEE